MKSFSRRFFGPDAGLAWIFVLPLILFMIGLIGYPFFSALALSLTKKTLGQPAEFIGLANYVELLSEDLRFMRVALNSIVYTVAAVAHQMRKLRVRQAPVVAGTDLVGDIGETDLAPHPAEVHLAHRQLAVVMDLEDPSGYAQTHRKPPGRVTGSGRA